MDVGDDDDFAFIATECPRCGSRMLPLPLPSGMVVLRCPVCGMVAI
jgi:hypothetical protein